MNQIPPQRVSSIPAPEKYELPGKPEASSPASNAYRQTQFLLGGDLDLFARAMNLQLALFHDAQPSKYRTHPLAAISGLWSRAYLHLHDGLLLVTRGSYASAVPLVRTAAEIVAAQEGLRGGEIDEHQKWLFETLQTNETHKAFEFELGRYFAGEVLAADPTLRAIYRPASDLGRPNFGATLLQMAPESNNLRLALAFGDVSFHLAWAELTSGWLLALAARQVRVIVDAEGIFPVSPARRQEYEELQAAIDTALRRDDRCSLREVEDGNDRRYLVQNFRRTSGAAPKKILL